MQQSAKKKLEEMARSHDLMDFKWVNPKEVVTNHWVRAKCLYGCSRYGKGACCPPEVPPVEECEALFREYRSGLFFHFALKFEKPEMRFPWTREMNKKILDLEKEVFLSGFYKAFVFPAGVCNICKECAGNKRECRQPYQARPTLEAFCVDVYATARKFGYHIQVVKDYQDEMNRFGLLLVE